MPINPLDPIARRVAVAHSAGQGRRPVFRETDASSGAARPENVSRRRSLAFDRSEHDGRLVAHWDGGACAARPALMALLVFGIMMAGLPPAAVAEPSPASASPVAPLFDRSFDRSFDTWAGAIAEAAERFAIPERWIRVVMMVASGGDPSRLSPRGAIGLMQLMPATWEALRTKYDLGDDPWEPRANILAGAALLRQVHDRYGTIDAMLAANHAGSERYDDNLRNGRVLPAETVAWPTKIMPMISGEASNRPTGDVEKGPPWRLAPLFVVRPVATGGDQPVSADPPSARPPNSRVVVDLSALVPPSDGLFVRAPAVEVKQRQ